MLSFKLLMSKLMYFTLYILNCTHPWHTFMCEYINMSNSIIIKWALFYQIIYIYIYMHILPIKKIVKCTNCCNFRKKIGLILHNLIEYGHHMNMESPMVLAHSCFGRFTKWFIITLSNLWTDEYIHPFIIFFLPFLKFHQIGNFYLFIYLFCCCCCCYTYFTLQKHAFPQVFSGFFLKKY
jgi:hypothetical protein